MIDLGTKVKLKHTNLSGEVVGHGYRYSPDGGTVPVYLVTLLDHLGFWNSDKTCYISTLVAHDADLIILEDAPVHVSF